MEPLSSKWLYRPTPSVVPLTPVTGYPGTPFSRPTCLTGVALGRLERADSRGGIHRGRYTLQVPCGLRGSGHDTPIDAAARSAPRRRVGWCVPSDPLRGC